MRIKTLNNDGFEQWLTIAEARGYYLCIGLIAQNQTTGQPEVIIISSDLPEEIIWSLYAPGIIYGRCTASVAPVGKTHVMWNSEIPQDESGAALATMQHQSDGVFYIECGSADGTQQLNYLNAGGQPYASFEIKVKI